MFHLFSFVYFYVSKTSIQIGQYGWNNVTTTTANQGATYVVFGRPTANFTRVSYNLSHTSFPGLLATTGTIGGVLLTGGASEGAGM